jgi:hypothetical protein
VEVSNLVGVLYLLVSKIEAFDWTVVKPATYDGKGPWLDYKSHFDACSEINHWSDKEKGLYLAVSLRGQAQGVLGNLGRRDLPGALHLDLTRAVSQQLFAFFLLAEFYTTQSGSRVKTAPLKT